MPTKKTFKNPVKKRNWAAHALCTSPLFKNRSIPDKKKKASKSKCRGKHKHDE